MKDIDYTNSAVDKKARRSRSSLLALTKASADSKNLTMFMIMMGFTFFSSSMWVGQLLAAGLDFSGFMESLLFGGEPSANKQGLTHLCVLVHTQEH